MMPVRSWRSVDCNDRVPAMVERAAAMHSFACGRGVSVQTGRP